jgi:hypothetical protein
LYDHYLLFEIFQKLLGRGGGGPLPCPTQASGTVMHACSHIGGKFQKSKISIYGKQNLISQAYSAVVGNVFTQRRYTIYLLKGQTRDASFIY